MNSKAKLKGYLRQARSDAGLRKSLLDNARFLKRAFGWLALASALLLLGRIIFEGWSWIWGPSTTLVFALMAYDKFADRIAMLESQEERPNQAPLPTPSDAAHL
jgi:hypothetical protein